MFWRLIFFLVGQAEPWDTPDPAWHVDVTSATVQALIARAEANEERERGAYVAWTYSRDRVVERRELSLESEDRKRARLLQASRDRHGSPLRMVV